MDPKNIATSEMLDDLRGCILDIEFCRKAEGISIPGYTLEERAARIRENFAMVKILVKELAERLSEDWETAMPALDQPYTNVLILLGGANVILKS